MPVSPDQLCSACRGSGSCFFKGKHESGTATIDDWYTANQNGCGIARREAVIYDPPKEQSQQSSDIPALHIDQ